MNIKANRITAIFDERARAEVAADELRQMGVDESQLSVIARQSEAPPQRDDAATRAESNALLNVAVALTPVVGPMFVAGKLLSAARKGDITSSIAAMLFESGAGQNEAREAGEAVENGGTLVVVDTSGHDENLVRAVLFKHGARNANA